MLLLVPTRRGVGALARIKLLAQKLMACTGPLSQHTEWRFLMIIRRLILRLWALLSVLHAVLQSLVLLCCCDSVDRAPDLGTDLMGFRAVRSVRC